jgi:hypothetical protein
MQAARLQTICRLELNCRLAELAIRNKQDMPVEELRAERSLVAQWSQQRDNALADLLGDATTAVDPWAILAAPATQPAAAAPAAAQPTDATTRIAEAAGTSPADATASNCDRR